MASLNNEQKKVADELDKIQIEQLHRATLSFSDNSQETKKLCVTVLTAVYALLAGIYKKDSLSELVISLSVLGVIIPILFYFVDVVLYYYQDRLRENMQKNIDAIKARHGIPFQSSEKRKRRLMRSFFNGSQIIYFGLLIASVIAPFLIKFIIEWWGKISA